MTVDDSEIKARVSAAGADGSFDQLLAEAESVARDPEDRLRLLSERVLMDLFRRNHKAKAHRQKRFGIVVSFGRIPKRKRSNLRRFRAQETPHSGPTIDEAVVESILTAMAAEKERLAVKLASPPRKVNLTLKFGGVTIARIGSLVSVS